MSGFWLLVVLALAEPGHDSESSDDEVEESAEAERPPPPRLGPPAPLTPSWRKHPIDVESEPESEQDQGEEDQSPEGSSEGSPPPTEIGGASDRIIVYGDREIDPERDALEKRLMDKGYDKVIGKDGYTIFRHDESWKGEFRVYDDGWVRYKRQPVQFRPNKNNALGWASCALLFPCLRSGGQTLSQRKWQGVRRRALQDADTLGRKWADRVADRSVDRRVERLPDQLEALWDEGVPLVDGAPKLPDVESRKAAILDHWESRTDTVWGDRVRAVIELFIRAEVQTSPWPFTDEEIRAFNARRTCEAVLDLDRSIDDLMEAMDKTSTD